MNACGTERHETVLELEENYHSRFANAQKHATLRIARSINTVFSLPTGELPVAAKGAKTPADFLPSLPTCVLLCVPTN